MSCSCRRLASWARMLRQARTASSSGSDRPSPSRRIFREIDQRFAECLQLVGVLFAASLARPQESVLGQPGGRVGGAGLGRGRGSHEPVQVAEIGLVMIAARLPIRASAPRGRPALDDLHCFGQRARNTRLLIHARRRFGQRAFGRLRLHARPPSRAGRKRTGYGALAGRQRRRRRGIGRRRPFGLGAQGRDRERRTQPRQIAQRHRLRRAAARQCQQLRLLVGSHRADGGRGLGHRPLHRRRRSGWSARSRRSGHRRGSRARSRPVPPVGHRCRRRDRDRPGVRGGGARRRPPDHQFRGRRRLGPAIAFLRRQYARLRRRLRQLAPLDLGGTDRFLAGQERRRHAARRPGTRRAARPPSWRRPPWSAVMPRSGRSPASARARSRPAKCRCSTNRRSLPGCSAPTCRPPAVAPCTANRPSCSTALASRRSPITSISARSRICRALPAAPPSTTKACARWRATSPGPVSSRATSSRPIRRASSA